MKVLCFLPDTLNFQNKLGMLTRSAGVEFQPCITIDEVKVFAAQEKNQNFFLFVTIMTIPSLLLSFKLTTMLKTS